MSAGSVVAGLRELLEKAGVPGRPDVEAAEALVVAALNALPDLLAVAEAAMLVKAYHHGARGAEWQIAHERLYDALARLAGREGDTG